jgi:VWFA-related protein
VVASVSAGTRRTRRARGNFRAILILFSFLILCQQSSAQAPAAKELSTQDVEPTYKLEIERNLVLVRAVVRNADGKTVDNLKQEDFQIFDNGKSQTISHFSAVNSTTAATSGGEKAEEPSGESVTAETELAPGSPQRFLALYIDDIHTEFGDIGRVRDAADAYLAEALTPGDRAGIFTSSGVGNTDFTGDLGRLHEALFRLRYRPLMRDELNPCPEIFDYQAYMMVHEHNIFAVDAAVEETLRCRYQGDRHFLQPAQVEAESAAYRKLDHYQAETESALRGLDEVIRRMALVPGQRHIILVSPGFLAISNELRIDQIADRALRSKIVISSLDTHGLFAPVPLGDASKEIVVTPDRPDLMGRKMEFQQQAITLRSQPLDLLAAATGGTFFRNSNDFQEGFRRTGALPEIYYSMAFSPEGLQFDGRFHTIKIKLTNFSKLAVEARRGYFAPLKSHDAATRAKEEITQALYSQDEVGEIPVEVHTQFFKKTELDASLAVVAHVDLRFIQFRRVDGRNLNDLTMVTALFDRNGNYLAGHEKRVEFNLLDANLEKMVQSGLNVRTTFAVKPGTYMVRQVVRETEGARISGSTRTVEIPY